MFTSTSSQSALAKKTMKNISEVITAHSSRLPAYFNHDLIAKKALRVGDDVSDTHSLCTEILIAAMFVTKFLHNFIPGSIRKFYPAYDSIIDSALRTIELDITVGSFEGKMTLVFDNNQLNTFVQRHIVLTYLDVSKLYDAYSQTMSIADDAEREIASQQLFHASLDALQFCREMISGSEIKHIDTPPAAKNKPDVFSGLIHLEFFNKYIMDDHEKLFLNVKRMNGECAYIYGLPGEKAAATILNYFKLIQHEMLHLYDVEDHNYLHYFHYDDVINQLNELNNLTESEKQTQTRKFAKLRTHYIAMLDNLIKLMENKQTIRIDIQNLPINIFDTKEFSPIYYEKNDITQLCLKQKNSPSKLTEIYATLRQAPLVLMSVCNGISNNSLAELTRIPVPELVASTTHSDEKEFQNQFKAENLRTNKSIFVSENPVINAAIQRVKKYFNETAMLFIFHHIFKEGLHTFTEILTKIYVDAFITYQRFSLLMRETDTNYAPCLKDIGHIIDRTKIEEKTNCLKASILINNPSLAALANSALFASPHSPNNSTPVTYEKTNHSSELDIAIFDECCHQEYQLKAIMTKYGMTDLGLKMEEAVTVAAFLGKFIDKMNRHQFTEHYYRAQKTEIIKRWQQHFTVDIDQFDFQIITDMENLKNNKEIRIVKDYFNPQKLQHSINLHSIDAATKNNYYHRLYCGAQNFLDYDQRLQMVNNDKYLFRDLKSYNEALLYLQIKLPSYFKHQIIAKELISDTTADHQFLTSQKVAVAVMFVIKLLTDHVKSTPTLRDYYPSYEPIIKDALDTINLEATPCILANENADAQEIEYTLIFADNPHAFSQRLIVSNYIDLQALAKMVSNIYSKEDELIKLNEYQGLFSKCLNSLCFFRETIHANEKIIKKYPKRPVAKHKEVFGYNHLEYLSEYINKHPEIIYLHDEAIIQANKTIQMLIAENIAEPALEHLTAIESIVLKIYEAFNSRYHDRFMQNAATRIMAPTNDNMPAESQVQQTHYLSAADLSIIEARVLIELTNSSKNYFEKNKNEMLLGLSLSHMIYIVRHLKYLLANKLNLPIINVHTNPITLFNPSEFSHIYYRRAFLDSITSKHDTSTSHFDAIMVLPLIVMTVCNNLSAGSIQKITKITIPEGERIDATFVLGESQFRLNLDSTMSEHTQYMASTCLNTKAMSSIFNYIYTHTPKRVPEVLIRIYLDAYNTYQKICLHLQETNPPYRTRDRTRERITAIPLDYDCIDEGIAALSAKISSSVNDLPKQKKNVKKITPSLLPDTAVFERFCQPPYFLQAIMTSYGLKDEGLNMEEALIVVAYFGIIIDLNSQQFQTEPAYREKKNALRARLAKYCSLGVSAKINATNPNALNYQIDLNNSDPIQIRHWNIVKKYLAVEKVRATFFNLNQFETRDQKINYLNMLCLEVEHFLDKYAPKPAKKPKAEKPVKPVIIPEKPKSLGTYVADAKTTFHMEHDRIQKKLISFDSVAKEIISGYKKIQSDVNEKNIYPNAAEELLSEVKVLGNKIKSEIEDIRETKIKENLSKIDMQEESKSNDNMNLLKSIESSLNAVDLDKFITLVNQTKSNLQNSQKGIRLTKAQKAYIEAEQRKDLLKLQKDEKNDTEKKTSPEKREPKPAKPVNKPVTSLKPTPTKTYATSATSSQVKTPAVDSTSLEHIKHLNQACLNLLFSNKILKLADKDIHKNTRHYALLYNIFRCFQSLKMYQECGGRKRSINNDEVANLRTMIIHHGAAVAEESSVINFAQETMEVTLPQNFMSLDKHNIELSFEHRQTIITEFQLVENITRQPHHAKLVIDSTPLYQKLAYFHEEKVTSEIDFSIIDRVLNTFIPDMINICKHINSTTNKTPLSNTQLFIDSHLFELQALRMLVTICGEFHGHFTTICGDKKFLRFLEDCREVRNIVGHDTTDMLYPAEFYRKFSASVMLIDTKAIWKKLQLNKPTLVNTSGLGLFGLRRDDTDNNDENINVDEKNDATAILNRRPEKSSASMS